MPYLHLQTNATPFGPEKRAFLEAASEFIASTLGKNLQYVMASAEFGRDMYFGGSDLPTAFVELKVLGLDTSKNNTLTVGLSDLARIHLHVPEDRCFCCFSDTPNGSWGLGNDIF